MPTQSNVRAGLLASLLFLGSAVTTTYAKDPPLLSLSMEHFRDTATVKEDLRDSTATITTEKGFVEYSGPLKMVWHDAFLSAAIDKKTGQKLFQVHEVITYEGSWRFYQSASYQSANGPLTAPAAQISKEAANCPTGECIYTEHVAFPVDEALLRQLAAAQVATKPVIWSYKITAKSGPAFDDGLSSAEIAGLLVKVDEYSGAAPAVRPGTAGAPLPLDLGIGGLPVAATAEHPNRAGVLITAVNRGSVANESGLIVGDILYEFDGHPVKALAELHAAVAASHPGSAAAIKLYRGLEPLTVTAQF
jgi:PDZ domain